MANIGDASENDIYNDVSDGSEDVDDGSEYYSDDDVVNHILYNFGSDEDMHYNEIVDLTGDGNLIDLTGDSLIGDLVNQTIDVTGDDIADEAGDAIVDDLGNDFANEAGDAIVGDLGNDSANDSANEASDAIVGDLSNDFVNEAGTAVVGDLGNDVGHWDDETEYNLNGIPLHRGLCAVPSCTIYCQLEMCTAHLESVMGLEVKQSNIPNAGFGLFATTTIQNNTKFATFIGEITEIPRINHYTIFKGNGEYIDCSIFRCAAACANLIHPTNCTQINYDNHAYLKSTKLINAGEEISFPYGNSFRLN